MINQWWFVPSFILFSIFVYALGTVNGMKEGLDYSRHEAMLYCTHEDNGDWTMNTSSFNVVGIDKDELDGICAWSH